MKYKLKNISVFYLILCLTFNLSSQNIYRFAGTGFLGFTPDGNVANGNPIGNPYGMCADNSGNIYFVENNLTIRKINSSGIIITVAGTHTLGFGFSGDGGPATAAQFNIAEGIAIDASGNIYVADLMNNRIRKINSSGIINTIAGTGTAGFSGDGGPAISAQIKTPNGITIDLAGNIYFSEEAGHRIRKIDPLGIISTVAGNGIAGFSGDGGPAIAAQINIPVGITTDAVGNVYFSDDGLSKVRKINTSGIISTLASSLIVVRNLVSDAAGNIYCTSKDIIKINPLGIITTIAGTGTPGYSGDGGPATSAQVGLAYAITLDPSNNIYFGQQGQGAYNQCLRVVCQSNCFAGINESNSEKTEISIYPNPVSNYLFISSKQYFSEDNEIEITNALGQTVLKSQYKSEINISHLSNGYYLLKILSPTKQHFYSRFVKQ